MFLFQTGSIRSVARELQVQYPSREFLFQTGSIRSEDDQEMILWDLAFLFQTGSIRSVSTNPLSMTITSVSIPNWFD